MSTIAPLVSVVMPVYNAKDYLRQSIESVIGQTFENFEFIIVNDGSTDRSLEIIESYDDERIKRISIKKRIGLVRSLNRALSYAKGKYIARQDADDISLPKRFEEQVRFLEAHPNIALLGTSFYVMNKKGEILKKEILPQRPEKGTCLSKGVPMIHGSAMFRRAAIDKLGPYRLKFEGTEDFELWLRMTKHYALGNLETPLYVMRIHESRISFPTLYTLRKNHVHTKLALKLTRGEIDISMIGSIEEDDTLNIGREFSIYKSLIKNLAGDLLIQNNLGRALLSIYHSLRGANIRYYWLRNILDLNE